MYVCGGGGLLGRCAHMYVGLGSMCDVGVSKCSHGGDKCAHTCVVLLHVYFGLLLFFFAYPRRAAGSCSSKGPQVSLRIV